MDNPHFRLRKLKYTLIPIIPKNPCYLQIVLQKFKAQ